MPPASADADRVSGPQSPDDGPVPVRIAPRRGPGSVLAIAVLGAVFFVGLFGRLIPDRAPPGLDLSAEEAGGSSRPSSPQGFSLVSPGSGVLWLGTTEIGIRGTAPSGMDRIDASLAFEGTAAGQVVLPVEARGRFSGILPVVPPALRTVGTLTVVEAGGDGAPLAEVPVLVEAGSVILISEPSRLRGQVAGVLIVDILVYGRLRELRGLLTGLDGNLIASTSSSLRAFNPDDAALPRTVALELAIPAEGVPPRARLHVLAIDVAGEEVAHIDANVALARR